MMKIRRRHAGLVIGVGMATVMVSCLPQHASGHERSLHAFLNARKAAAQRDAAQSEPVTDPARCRLSIQLQDAQARRPLPGLIRITRADNGKAVELDDLIRRDANWYVVPERVQLQVPCSRLVVEAIHGIDTELARRELDLTQKTEAELRLPLHRFYDPRQRGLRSGNTHLHLMRLTHAEADHYLRLVPKADGLDLVFLSYLRRLPDERHYISNQFTIGDLKRVSQDGVLFSNGEEHRHNFGRGGEGYGHVMLLDIVKLIRPVSIGPGIMGTGTDGISLQRGIRAARDDGASVIWCHNKFGLEDVPNWMAGLLHAQNIFDGGTHGSYQDSFYRYLNLGLNVPFSTGTDWFIYDFSRVFVPVDGELSSEKWLQRLAQGRSYITNGTFLELQVDGRAIGDTIALKEPASLAVRGRGLGRNAFTALELVHNGQVVHTVAAKQLSGHYEATLDYQLAVREPGWVALRIALQAGQNELGKELFAHTSPVYIEMSGKRIFQPQVARELIEEMQQSMNTIREKGTFAGSQEREAVLQVYRNGIQLVRQRLKAHR